MKKLLPIALLLLAIPFVMNSCSDDDDLPNVDYTITISGGVMDNATNTIYVVRGDTLSIDSLSVTNLDSDKPAALTNAEYFWDYMLLGYSPLPPFGYDIYVTDNTKLGEHVLSIRTGVVAVDKEPAVGIVTYTVNVVETDADLPTGSGSRSHTVTPGLKIK